MRQATMACLVAAAILLAPPPARAAPFDETKLGVIAHDLPVGGDSREAGIDLDGELLFVSPDLLAPI